MRSFVALVLIVVAYFTLAAEKTPQKEGDEFSRVPPALIVGPYRHVRPEDAGVTIGAGVIAPFPTRAYRGPMKISSPTTIENVVVEGCLRIESDNVILRNVVIRCDSFYPVKATDHSDFRIEYSLVQCSKPTKVFRLINYQNFVVHRTETRGCEDLFVLSGNNDGLEVTYNYMHSLTLTPKSHADGFQFGKVPMSGSAVIRGNYFWANAEGPKTDIVFAGGASPVQFRIEDNFFRVWGLRTIRCSGPNSSCIIRNNVYEQAYEDMYLLRYGKLLFAYLKGSGDHAASCNRLEDGTMAKEHQNGIDRFFGVNHEVNDCPEWPYK
ncbi:hypothetical protein AWR36_013300 [Microbulbifer flavimaris]|uniref:Right handed beta helix region n=1 Tax=Microbulbifer flavimaris TaxID=1781068 RepID=A0ABX4HWF5_9GAMM|nr:MULTISPECIES: hypothetical protein [Microbulbifer]KUJ81525.1 hypothetical protein AVO43_13275 [Microbulbifer sp. ZGT114]PCO04430.1 hypothetical protein AWR36_013300 [Microbulbifer flavimaris]